ncbi:MAG: type II toxin-antitoxin system VapC family toxin [Stellaceae bacterium]
MIVIDASALLELLLEETPAADAVATRLFRQGDTIHVPHLLDLEIANVLRRRALAGLIAVERCRDALGDVGRLRLFRHPHNFLLARVWELRDNLSAYDAMYVALAEFLNAPLLTRDRRMANAVGHRARIELV